MDTIISGVWEEKKKRENEKKIVFEETMAKKLLKFSEKY